MTEQDIKKIKNIRRSLQSASKNAGEISDNITKEMLTRAFGDMNEVLGSILKHVKDETLQP
jgi:hypothetical protein